MNFNRTLLSLCIYAFLPFSLMAVDFPSDFSKRAPIIINGAQVPSPQTNIPIVLRTSQFPADMLDNNGINDAKNGGGDVRFSSDPQGQNQLACEIVRFTTGASPAVEVWVKVNNLNSPANTTIYVWWGNPNINADAVGAAFGRNAVWSNNYTAVYHLDENQNGAAGHYKDSSGNHNSLATANPPTRNNNGSVGRAATFNANNNQEIVLPTSLDTGANATIQGWVSTTNMSGFRTWFGKSDTWNAANMRWRCYNRNNGSNVSGIGRPGSEVGWPAATYTATPGHFNIILSGGNAQLIHNGVNRGQSPFTQGSDATARVSIGNSAGEFWSGTIDEVRVSSVARSQNWIITEYRNQSNPAAFFQAAQPITDVAARYWIGNNNDWNDVSNWSISSGGPGGYSIPGLYNPVYFDQGSAQSATTNQTIYALSLDISNAAQSIIATNQTVNISDSLQLGPGSLNNSNGILNIGGDLIIGTGSLNHSNATLNTTGSSTQVLSLNSNHIHHLNINGTGGVNLNGNTTINGDVTIANSGLGSNSTITFNGNLIVNNSLNFMTASAIFNGTSTISGTSIPTFNTIVINNTATVINTIASKANSIQVNGLLINNGQLYAGTDFIDFSTSNITGHGGGQDAGGTATVEDGGRTLFQSGNTWKKIDFSYTHTANTRLYFDFYSDVQGEIHAMGIEDDDNITSNNNFRVFGTQNWARNFETYASGDGWVHYEIPSGNFITGLRPYLTFVNDHDAGPSNGQSRFRNVRVVEDPIPSITVTVGDNGTLGGSGEIHGSVIIPNTGRISPGNSSTEEISIIYGSNTGITLNQESELFFDLGTNSDRISLIGSNSDLILDGKLHVTNSGGLTDGLYPLFSCLGNITDNELEIETMPLGFIGEIQISTLGNVNYVYLDVTTGNINIVWDDTNDTADKSWALGIMVAGAKSGAQNWAIRNDGTITLDLEIDVAPSVGAGWVSGTSAGNNQFVIDVDTNFDGTEDVQLDSSRLLRNALPPANVHQFNTWFTCPTRSSTASAQSINMTVTATAD